MDEIRKQRRGRKLPRLSDGDCTMDIDSLVHLVQQIKDRVDEVYESLVGDISDKNKPGLIVRLDRAEQTLETMKRKMWMLGGSLVTVVATLIINHFISIR